MFGPTAEPMHNSQGVREASLAFVDHLILFHFVRSAWVHHVYTGPIQSLSAGSISVRVTRLSACVSACHWKHRSVCAHAAMDLSMSGTLA